MFFTRLLSWSSPSSKTIDFHLGEPSGHYGRMGEVLVLRPTRSSKTITCPRWPYLVTVWRNGLILSHLERGTIWFQLHDKPPTIWISPASGSFRTRFWTCWNQFQANRTNWLTAHLSRMKDVAVFHCAKSLRDSRGSNGVWSFCECCWRDSLHEVWFSITRSCQMLRFVWVVSSGVIWPDLNNQLRCVSQPMIASHGFRLVVFIGWIFNARVVVISPFCTHSWIKSLVPLPNPRLVLKIL